MSIYNDAPALAEDWESMSTGVGIKNLRSRLEIMHGDQCALQLHRADPGGVEVVVSLPFVEA